MTTSPSEESSAALETLGEDLAGLRLSRADDLAAMRASLDRHGQLTPLVVFGEPPQWVIVDGFKRLHAARALGWKELGVRVLPVLTRAHAKASVLVLNDRRGLSELEEAWLCRALYREDHLPQPAIAQLLGRHKSWVCRRLMLAESLEDTVVADVRLGLLCVRAACAIARLPRDNQRPAATVVMQRGLTVPQTERWVTQMLASTDEAERLRLLQNGPPLPAGRAPLVRTRSRTPAESILSDIDIITRRAARLQARLLGAPLSSLGEGPCLVITAALEALLPVLTSLGHVTERVICEDIHHACLE